MKKEEEDAESNKFRNITDYAQSLFEHSVANMKVV